MKSGWYSIRAWVVVVAMLGFGGVLSWLALHGNGEAVGALIAFIGSISTFYFAAPTGGAPHAPTS
jgi:hypothetical protein